MSTNPPSFDALMPKDMAVKAENIGIAKAGLGAYRMFALAILAGAFIAMGANYATTVWAGLGKIVLNGKDVLGAGKDLILTTGFPYGLQRLLGGIAAPAAMAMRTAAPSQTAMPSTFSPQSTALAASPATLPPSAATPPSATRPCMSTS